VSVKESDGLPNEGGLGRCRAVGQSSHLLIYRALVGVYRDLHHTIGNARNDKNPNGHLNTESEQINQSREGSLSSEVLL